MFRSTYRPFLLVHHVVIHSRAKDPALVEEPRLLNLDEFATGFQHVLALGHAMEEGQSAAHLSVDAVGSGIVDFLRVVPVHIRCQRPRL